MSWFQVFFLSIVQGLTEFLPVSSSGHLVLFQKIFGLKPPILFDIFVHVGTLGAIIFYFKRELKKLIIGILKKENKSLYFFLLIVIGTIPAVIVGLLLEKRIEMIFDSFRLVGITLLITGILLLLTNIYKGRAKKDKVASSNWKDALFVGIFQALAILPGISRSGATISAGLFRKFDRNLAFKFSFFLAIPAIMGALILQIPDLINYSSNSMNQALIGMIIAGIVGVFALKILKKVLINSRLHVFAVYCLLLGAGVLFFS